MKSSFRPRGAEPNGQLRCAAQTPLTAACCGERVGATAPPRAPKTQFNSHQSMYSHWYGIIKPMPWCAASDDDGMKKSGGSVVPGALLYCTPHRSYSFSCKPSRCQRCLVFVTHPRKGPPGATKITACLPKIQVSPGPFAHHLAALKSMVTSLGRRPASRLDSALTPLREPSRSGSRPASG